MTENRFLRFHILQAGYGDCLVIEYGDDPKCPYIVIIDGGVGESTTRELKKFLKSMPGAQLELLVVSHVDDDHIVGATRLLKDKAIRARIKDIWFNGATQKIAGLEEFGFKQGDKLEEMLGDASLKLPWNAAFNTRDVVVDLSTRVKPTYLPLGATITLLSPTVESLHTLREAWIEHGLKNKKNEAGKTGITSESDMVKSKNLEPMGARDIPKINVGELLKEDYDEDQSPPNGSSIAFIFEFGDGSLLLAADAHSSVLLESAAMIYEGKGCKIDVFKLPHHGSAANVTVELLKTFPSKTYVISTDGGKHNHPHDLAIARIADISPGSVVKFNYPSDAYERWRKFCQDNKDVLHVDSVEKPGKILKIDVPISAKAVLS